MAVGGGGGGSYNCESLVEVVYVKWPILFSAFNMMSDWIHWFSFTEGFIGFLLLIFNDDLPWTCLHFFIEFCNCHGKPKCNSSHYLHNLMVN